MSPHEALADQLEIVAAAIRRLGRLVDAQPSTEEGRLLNSREAAALIGVCKNTLSKIAKKNPRCVKRAGRVVRYEPSELKAAFSRGV